MSIVCGFNWPSIYCGLATHVTGRISSIGDSTYNSNWYDYPPELRKFVNLIITRSQEPVYFTGFNLIGCTLEIFGKVIQLQ